MRLQKATKLHLAGRLAEAEAEYRQILRHDPRNVGALQNLGLIEAESSRTEAAEKHFRLALRYAPNSADLWLALARMLVRLDLLPRAVSAFEAALKIDGGSATAHAELAATLHTLKQFDRAVVHYRKAIALGQDTASLHNETGVAYRMLGMMDEAFEAFQQAAVRDPTSAPIQSNMGSILLERGDISSAVAAFERAWELAPQEPVYLHNMTEAKTFRRDDPRLATYLQTMETVGALSAQNEIYRHFALGNIYDDLGEHALAARHLTAGNRVKRASIAYDERATLGDLDKIIRTFTPDLLGSFHGYGDPTTTPVFIIGLPRSGSTLVNQILSSHGQVHGAGEIDIFGECVNQLADARLRDNARPPVAELVTRLDGRGVTELGRRYAERINDIADGAARVTDKLLANFRCLGLIKLALPQARIIHVSRNPADIALSCFSKLFQGDHPYTYDLREFGRYFRGYERLMAHWEKTLPPGSMLNVRYEALVTDVEAEARRMLDFCGLAWEPGCLNFHAAQGWVKTASAAQVRKPIYRSAVNRADAYRDMLAPFLDERSRA